MEQFGDWRGGMGCGSGAALAIYVLAEYLLRLPCPAERSLVIYDTVSKSKRAVSLDEVPLSQGKRCVSCVHAGRIAQIPTSAAAILAAAPHSLQMGCGFGCGIGSDDVDLAM